MRTRPFLRSIRGWLSLLCLLAFGLAAVSAQSPAVTLVPAVVLAGAPELIRVSAPGAASIDGEWLGRKLEFFRGLGGNAWFALSGVDVDAPAGPSKLKIMVHDAKGGVRPLNRTIRVQSAHYRTSSLTVAPEFVQPSPEALKQIAADQVLTEKAYASSAPTPLWKGNFRPPMVAPQTERFGTRRIFNGVPASNHKGLDYRAAPGSPVRASNSGVVVLAGPLYYAGNSVFVDHGMGLFTLYMHFSKITVREGQHIVRGQKLGLSGATGRVTGPHLHWAVRWQGAYLDPAKLLHLDLSAAH